MSLRYLSLFSGIEAASVAWKPLGWTCVGVAEIEPMPCSLLAHYYPRVPNLGNVALVTQAQIAALGHIDVLVFGSPCQDLSLAGKRKGFNGERSSLFFDAMRIVQWAREHCGLRWAIWENVPGAFSSNGGADFASVVEHMAGLDSVDVPPRGWGTEGCAVGEEGMVEWSTLDAQWFGVAQRRRRVFAVADFGDWANRPPVLLESESLRGHSAPSRSAQQELTTALATGAGEHAAAVSDHEIVSSLDASFQKLQGCSGQDARHGHSHLVPVALSVALRGRDGGATAELGDEVAGCLRASGGGGDKPHALVYGFNARQDPDSWLDRAGPLDTFSNTQAVAFVFKPSHFTRDKDGAPSVVVPPLSADADKGDQETIVCAPVAFGGNNTSGPIDVATALNACGTSSGRMDFESETFVATPVYAFKPGQSEAAGGFFVTEGFAPTLQAINNGSTAVPAVAYEMHGAQWRVRRLTPLECERLQAYPDHYTLVLHKGKPAADSPRYKALGNSMCVNVMRWIGRSVEFAHNY